MRLKLLLVNIFALNIIYLNAGTIIYKANSKGKENILGDVKIVSIAKKTITIEKDGGIRTISLGCLISYYDTDIDGGTFEDNTCDYAVTVREIKMPETGYEYKNAKKSKKKTKSVSECEIEFSVNKSPEKGESKSIRMPYFYLYVLTTGTESYGRRPVYTYYYPKEAKITTKVYDEAKIIEAVNSMKRPRIYNEGKAHFEGSVGKLTMGGYKPISISLKGVKEKKIIAYHLEIWGKNKMIIEKNWKKSNYKVGKDWWKRY